MVEQHFCLRWNNYRTNITAEFETLREGEHFVDVTLACDGQQLKAHKVVLSACSPYFKILLQGNPCSHPIIILRDVAYTHMRSLLEFMYAGEVNISQAQLGAFLHTAEALKIRGLAESSDDRKNQSGINSVSPLAALKSSLGGLSSMALGGLGPSILERPLVPQLLAHHSDKQQVGLTQVGSHLLASHLLPPGPPPPQSLAAIVTLPTSSSSSPGLGAALPPPSFSNVSLSSIGSAVPGPPPGPLPLTVAHLSQSSEQRPLSNTPPHRDPSPTHHPNKRIRTEHRINTYESPLQSKPNHTGTDSTNGTTPCTLIASTKTSTFPEDALEAVPKVEPVDASVSEGEGVGGEWCLGGEEGDSSSGPGLHGSCVVGMVELQQQHQQDGQQQPGTPGPTPSEGTPPHPNNTSHLLQALKSESHLQGCAGQENAERPFHCDDTRHIARYDIHTDIRSTSHAESRIEISGNDIRSNACDDNRNDMRGDSIDVRSTDVHGELRDLHSDMRMDVCVAERPGSSPPLPPSSLPHSCQLCGKLISCRRNLWKHMERVHFNNPAVRCSLCAKMFKNKYALKDHQRIYHGGLSEPVHPPQSASLLSRILQDPRHQPLTQSQDQTRSNQMDLQHPPPLMSHESHMRHSLEPIHQQGFRRHLEEEDGGNPIPYPGIGPMLPQSLASNLVGPPSSMRAPRTEWHTQDDPLSLVNRALLSELHHFVTKAD